MEAKGRLEFSQQRGIFATDGQFRSGGVFSQAVLQPISQLQNEGVGLRNGTRVPRSGFVAAKRSYGCEIGIFKALEISQSIFAAAKWG